MKKAMCMIALAAISFGSVVAAPIKPMAQDTTMKMKKTMHKKMHKKMMKKKSSKMMTDTSKMKM